MVVSLTDGSSLKLPRRWTDADGIACTDLSGDSPITLHGLRELLRLFIALRERARGAGSEHDAKIDSPHASAVPKVRVNGRSEDVIFFDGVFFESSLKSIFFAS